MIFRVYSFLVALALLPGFQGPSFGAGKNPETEPISIGFINPKYLAFDIAEVDDAETVFVIKQISQSLVENDRNGKIIASIAKYWTISSDMKTYKFFLRDDIFFPDGSQLTSVDIEYALSTIRNSTKNPLNFYLKKINKIEVLTPFEIHIELSSPWFGFLHCLSSGLVPIFSSTSYKKDKSFVGTGSYQLSIAPNNIMLLKNPNYRGHYQSIHSNFKILLNSDDYNLPDIIVGRSSNFSGSEIYKKIEADSFSGTYFMINPAISVWKSKDQRLSLIRALIEAKKIINGSDRKDLKDIFPKGMPGFDIQHAAYDLLTEEIQNSKLLPIEKNIITIGSAVPLPRFIEIQKAFKNQYGIDLRNSVVGLHQTLTRLGTSKDIDVFAIGWNSIFSHPDATLLPFLILGIENSDPTIENSFLAIGKQKSQIGQHNIYRKISFDIIRNGYALPIGQRTISMLSRQDILAPIYRYRYTLQLSEIARNASQP